MNNMNHLAVFLYNEHVGNITYLGQDRTLFSFTESYIEDTQRPILSLRFKDTLGSLITTYKPTQTQLLPFFSNVLPEGVMRDYLASRVGVNPVREFFLLAALGRDLPGALSVRMMTDHADLDDKLPGDKTDHPENTALRFSLAGAQLKFSVIAEASGGLTIPASGMGGSWIIKLPSAQFEQVPENEYAMMEMARLLGMNVPETCLIPMESINGLPEGVGKFGQQVFAIKRFDRSPEGLIHTEDFAQIFGVYPHNKYQRASMRNIAHVLSTEGEDEDLQELVRRLVFTMLIGNADMHLKNWSVIYRDRHKVSIAPAYDFVSTVPYLPDDRAALTVSRSKKFSDFSFDELSHFATKTRLSEKMVVDVARQTVQQFQEIWQQEKKHFPLSKQVILAIDHHLKRVPLVREMASI